MRLIRCVVALAMTLPGPLWAQAGAVDFPVVRQIVSARCGFCHTAVPQEDGLNGGSQPPKGVKFDTLADYRKFAPLILGAAVATQRMPPDNATHMTETERATLGRWIEAGAVVP